MTEYYEAHIPLVLTNDGDEGTFWIPWRNTVELLEKHKKVYEDDKCEMRAAQQKLIQQILKLRSQVKVITDAKESLEIQLAQQRVESSQAAQDVATINRHLDEVRSTMTRLEDRTLKQLIDDTRVATEVRDPVIVKVESIAK